MITTALELPRTYKSVIVYMADLISVAISLALALRLRYGTWDFDVLGPQALPLFVTVVLFAAALFILMRVPQTKLSAFEDRAMLRIAMVSLILVLFSVAVSYFIGLSTPRSVPLIFGALFFVTAISSRLIALQILTRLNGKRDGQRISVAIYGAGSAGIQLASALHQSREAKPAFFFDDNPTLQGLMIAGIPVHRPSRMNELLAQHNISRVLLAMPSTPSKRQQELVDKIMAAGFEVQILPSFIDLMSNKGLSAQLSPVSPLHLLGRNKVELDVPEIAKTYAGRVVMVTGAGGSIGSELCRQLVNCRPARIVLFERGEFALYSVHRELQAEAKKAGIGLTARLGSVTNAERVAGVLAEEKVDIILHAAAYKHVPLVEENETQGAENNVLGTKTLAEEARKAKIERFILISTDKAVRPTNIMGATKRLAELVVQDAQSSSDHTKYAMVRFGNVLGSSGSVLPLFQKQIETGGPITVTHPDVTRFFMTIPEAARLVLLAGAYAEGGDVFVLDMGQPQKIIDIAKKLIVLSGRTVKDPDTGIGDIAIEITGLRPGEKLYEELLLDDASLVSTPHPKILRARESRLSPDDLQRMLIELEGAIAAGSGDEVRRLIDIYVEGYQRPAHANAPASAELPRQMPQAPPQPSII